MSETTGRNFIERDKIEEIVDKLDIVDLVSKYVNLKKAGQNYKGLCPFHDEKTPSFVVSQNKQIYHCFGCGEGGNVLNFYMKVQNKTFPEAIKDLADMTGIEIEENLSPEEIKRKQEKERLYFINETATKFFEKNLWEDAKGQNALNYLFERGLDQAVMKKFRLGWASDSWNNLRDHLIENGIKIEELSRLGLVSKSNKNDDYFDKFRKRIIFPIFDFNDRVIAFGGRILGPGEPKYLNSPDTPLFNKGYNLYAQNLAKSEIRKNDYSVLVEGYMDVISCHQNGIKNAIASLGTSLTKEQAKSMLRFSPNNVIAYDGDDAGQLAAERAIDILLQLEMNSKVAVFPDKKDPDEFLREFGIEGFNEILKKAKDPIVFKLELFIRGKNLTIDLKYKAIENISGYIFKIKSPLLRENLLKKVARTLDLRDEMLKAELRRIFQEGRQNRKNLENRVPERKSQRKDYGAEFDKNQIALLRIIAENPQFIDKLESLGGKNLFQKELQEAYMVFTNRDKDDKINNLGQDENRKFFSYILLSEIVFDDVEKAFDEILKKTYCNHLDEKYKEKQMELRTYESQGKLEEVKIILLELSEILQVKEKIRKGAI